MMQSRRRLRASPELGDAALVARIASGDLGSLGMLYDRYAPSLLRFARRVAGPQDAADIVQSAFLRVVAIAGTYDGSAPSARPWLFGIVARVTQEHRRSLKRWAGALLRLSQEPARTLPGISESRKDLVHCLSGLALPKRTVLVLVEVEGFTCQEVADMLAIPIGTVWARLHHARQELRRFYGEADA